MLLAWGKRYPPKFNLEDILKDWDSLDVDHANPITIASYMPSLLRTVGRTHKRNSTTGKQIFRRNASTSKSTEMS